MGSRVSKSETRKANLLHPPAWACDPADSGSISATRGARGGFSGFGLRVSDFGLLSAFGFRASGFRPVAAQNGGANTMCPTGPPSGSISTFVRANGRPSITFCRSCAPFPLTPPLSLREREPHKPTLEDTGRPRFADTLPAVRPLPEGEGRGEGERGARRGRCRRQAACGLQRRRCSPLPLILIAERLSPE